VKRLIRAEMLKLRTTPLFLFSFAAVPVVAGLVILAVYGAAGHQGNDPLGPESLVHAVGAQASILTTMALLLGVVGMAGEYRHKTITTTLLASPRRRDVIVAKVAAHAIFGAAMAVVSVAAAVAVAVPWLVGADVAVGVGGDLVRIAGGLVLGTALHGALGVAAGALVRNQTAAVTVVLVWLLKGEEVLAGLLASTGIGDWLPAALGSALVRPSAGDLSLWVAGPALAAYVIAMAVLGARLVVSRDVT
jgi:ABC-2 type transport system permease protein